MVIDLDYEARKVAAYFNEYLPLKSKLARAKKLLTNLTGKKENIENDIRDYAEKTKDAYDKLKDDSNDSSKGSFITYFDETCESEQKKDETIVNKFKNAKKELVDCISKLQSEISVIESQIRSLEQQWGF